MLEMDKSYIDQMVAHALEDDPNECCGMLAGSGGVATKLYRMTNTAHSPYRYDMETQELFDVTREIDDSGGDLLVIYHSHTHSPAYPSDTDVRIATWPDGKSAWPGTYYILVSLEDHDNPDVRAYSITDGVITEEEISVV